MVGPRTTSPSSDCQTGLTSMPQRRRTLSFPMRAGGHSSVSSRAALGIASITRETVQPTDGMIETMRPANRQASSAQSNTLVDRFVPVATAEEPRPSFTRSLRDQLSFGITSLVMADETVETGPSGSVCTASILAKLPCAAGADHWNNEAELRAFGKRSGDGDEWLRVGALKVFVDGGFTGPSATCSRHTRDFPVSAERSIGCPTSCTRS